MPSPPRKETISSRISADLRQAILQGELAPGAKINLDRLRRASDVSISPLREALARLVADGLVEFEDQRGYRVAPVSPEDLAEVTRLRAVLEPMALESSIIAGDLDWESDVMRALYRLTRGLQDGPRPDPAAMRDKAEAGFHMALIGGCGMPRLIGLCAMLSNMNDRYRRLYPPPPDAVSDIAAACEAIAQAATRRDAPRAVDALRTLILNQGAALRDRVAAPRT
jgi:DNA-binding GntR family transcriptional regulator